MADDDLDITVEFSDGTSQKIGTRRSDETIEQWAERQGRELDAQWEAAREHLRAIPGFKQWLEDPS